VGVAYAACFWGIAERKQYILLSGRFVFSINLSIPRFIIYFTSMNVGIYSAQEVDSQTNDNAFPVFDSLKTYVNQLKMASFAPILGISFQVTSVSSIISLPWSRNSSRKFFKNKEVRGPKKKCDRKSQEHFCFLIRFYLITQNKINKNIKKLRNGVLDHSLLRKPSERTKKKTKESQNQHHDTISRSPVNRVQSCPWCHEIRGIWLNSTDFMTSKILIFFVGTWREFFHLKYCKYFFLVSFGLNVWLFRSRAFKRHVHCRRRHMYKWA